MSTRIDPRARDQNVVIFGATSAIAGEVVKLLAQRGARLHLIGRNPEKLAAAAANAGRHVSTQQADLRDLDENERVVNDAVAALGYIDLALIAHGDLGDQLATEKNFKDAEETLRVNFTSVVSLLVPLANHLEAARSGQIAVITSVAGDRGRPRNYTYGTAKGALNIYLQGLRSRLRSAGVGVTTLKLGPVDTPMTRDHAKHFLFGKPQAVAQSIVRAIDHGAAEAYVPFFWRFIMAGVVRMPEAAFQRLRFLSGR